MKKKKKQKKGFRFSSFIVILILLVLMAATSGAALVASYVLSVVEEAPPIDPENFRNRIMETSKIYTVKGELLETLVQSEFSEYVTIDKVPDDLKNAVVAIEDMRFYEHSAIDFKRVMGAIVENLKAKRFKEGASTITMQLAKNLYTGMQKDMTRKLTDVYYSFQMENVLTKDQILEAYLNSSGFSKGAVGVQAAAKSFFNKNVWDLNLAECALIAGVTNRPEAYTPYNSMPIEYGVDDLSAIQVVTVPLKDITVNEHTNAIAEELKALNKIDSFEEFQIKQGQLAPMKAVFNPSSKKRQEKVLKKMWEQGKIDQAQYDTAVATPIVLNLGRRNKFGISSQYLDIAKDETIKILKDLGYEDVEAHNRLYNGGLKIYVAMNMDIQKSLEKSAAEIKLSGEKVNENGELQPQIGAVVMDPYNGHILGIIGGRKVGGGRITNRATLPRQPGSSIKPISVYLTAFNNGATAGDIYLDQSLQGIDLPYINYQPKNVGSYRGWQSIRQLLVQSSNVGTYLVARDLSANLESKQNKYSQYSKVVNNDENFKKMVTTLEELGVSTIVHPEDSPTNDYNYAALTLGGLTKGISPLEMAVAYSVFPNKGEVHKPVFVTQIESSDGKVIYKNPESKTRVTSEQNAYIMTDILKDVVKKSTGRRAQIKNMTIAGKTGTTNDKKEVWFVGYSPYYVCSVMLGNDDHTPLRFNSLTAAGIFADLMGPIHEGLENKDFVMPDKINRKYISALGYTELIPEGYTPRNQGKPGYFAPEEEEEEEEEDGEGGVETTDREGREGGRESNRDGSELRNSDRNNSDRRNDDDN